MQDKMRCMQDRIYAGQGECRTGLMQSRVNAGQD